jgi:hypothetical protein
VRTADYWDVYWDLMRQVKERFDEEGVNIPFPQRDLHFPGAIEVRLAGTHATPRVAPTQHSAGHPKGGTHNRSTYEPGPANVEMGQPTDAAEESDDNSESN